MTDTDTTMDILILTRILLSHPDHWTKGTLWRDRAGSTICRDLERETAANTFTPPASFCLSGALQHAAHELGLSPRAARHHLGMVAHQLWMAGPHRQRRNQPSRWREPLVCLVEWNDHPRTTHVDILAVLDRGITNLTVREVETLETETQEIDYVCV